MKIVGMLVLAAVILVSGCEKKTEDPRISLKKHIQSDSIVDNIVTRPIASAFSALIGEGIEIDQAVLKRNEAGFLELYINGHNRSYNIKKFRYKVEWLDGEGLVIETKASVWQTASAMNKSPFNIKAVAPRAEAVNFRMDTRKWE